MTSPTPTVICAGAAHWDIIAAAGAALPSGADVPGTVRSRPGGVAANLARFLAASGLHPLLLSAISDSPEGDALIRALQQCGIDCTSVMRIAGPCDRYVAIETGNGELHAAVADCRSLAVAGPRILAPFTPPADPALQFAVDGNLAPEVILAIRRLAAASQARFFLLAASPEKAPALRDTALAAETTLFANRAEAEALCGTKFRDSAEAAETLCRAGTGRTFITDGACAAASCGPDGLHVAMPPRIIPRSVTGAGDCFAAACISALASGRGSGDALAKALRAAAAHLSGAADETSPEPVR